MENFKLIQKLEQVSIGVPDKILRLKGYVLNDRKKEYLEIIIYRGFSSSTTHPIDPDLENKVINKNYFLKKCQLLEAPISELFNPILKDVENIELFLNIDYWN